MAENIIIETSFPLFSVSLLGDSHLAIAGGGGEAKTGVPNLIELYSIDYDQIGGKLAAVKVGIIDTESLATMNMDIVATKSNSCDVAKDKAGSSAGGVGPGGRGAPIDSYSSSTFTLATGQDRLCKLYRLTYSVACLLNDQLVSYQSLINQARGSCPTTPMKKPSKPGGMFGETEHPEHQLPPSFTRPLLAVGFEVSKTGAVQTDSHPKMPFQKVVRISPDGKKFITGGADGHCRVWDAETLKKVVDNSAHRDDVDDISIVPGGARFLTIGRDKRGFIWNMDGSKFCEIPNPPPGVPEKYLFRAGRFSVLGRNGNLVYTVSIPIVKKARGVASYICQWIMLEKQLVHIKTVVTGNEATSTLALSPDGKFLAIGTLSGSVQLWDALEMTLVRLFPAVHDTFVTGLAVLPACPKPGSKLSLFMHSNLAGCVSVSVDNTVRLHAVPHPVPGQLTWKLFGWSVMVWVVALLLNWLEF